MTLDLDELERLGKAATPWRWKNSTQPDAIVTDYCADMFDVRDMYYGGNPIAESIGANNKAFIIAARNNWQAMINRIRELEIIVENKNQT